MSGLAFAAWVAGGILAGALFIALIDIALGFVLFLLAWTAGDVRRSQSASKEEGETDG